MLQEIHFDGGHKEIIWNIDPWLEGRASLDKELGKKKVKEKG